MEKQAHAWQFVRAGGVDQVVISTGADIANLAQLDQKLWVALACPTRGIGLDSATLDFIDHDKDGRIRAPELLQACQWAVAHVKDPDSLAQSSDVLALSNLRADSEEGAAMLAEAQRILAFAGREGAAHVSLAEVQKRLADLNAMPFNGDGVLNPETLGGEVEPELLDLVRRIMDGYGATMGCDDQPGLAAAALESFFADVQAMTAWHTQAQALDGRLFGGVEQARAAAQALNAVQGKVEDFFARTRLAAFDAKALEPISPSAEGYALLGQQQLSATADAIAALPLSRVVPGGALPLHEGVNPAWEAPMQALRTLVVQPVLGDVPSLDAAQWAQLKATLAPYQAWLAALPQSPVAEMDAAQAQALLASNSLQRLQDLMAHDEAEKTHSAHAVALEKLIRLQRDLMELLNNFVSFSRFYRREGAAFQAGRLLLDGRSCDLTVDVVDPAAHATLAGMAKVCLAYCECRRGGVKRHIVAAFTAGDVDFLFVGRNGIFYDRDGLDWDASITKLIENPTSIGQAFASPYKKFVRMVEEQVAKRAAAKDTAVTASLDAQASKLTALAAPPAAPAAAVAGKKTDVGTVAAIGVAMGSISAVLVGVFGKFIELGPWIPVALLGIILAISGPSMLIAWLKLRERSLGPILDASGWAINGRMKINLPLGQSLSQTGKVPLTAKRSLNDPFAQEGAGRWVLGAVVVVLAATLLSWRMGWLNSVLPAAWQVGAATAVAAEAPATPATPAAPAALEAPAAP